MTPKIENGFEAFIKMPRVLIFLVWKDIKGQLCIL